MKSGNQTETGKAFEYACARAIATRFSKNTEVNLVDSPQMTTARKAFINMEGIDRVEYTLAAEAAVKIINRLEPNLSSQLPLLVGLQTDAAGITGDVRDVLCMHHDGWEIGLSCKHNHEAVKHSRLSDTINFGKDWFGKTCSEEYFKAVRKVFLPLRVIRDESKAKGKPAKWNIIEDKEEDCYVPILKAFMQELKRLDAEYPKEIPGRLIKYLIGVNDFYKVIMNSQRRFTVIEAININGTLNQKCGSKKALIDVPIMKLPTRFYEVDFKENSRNTIVVVCDNGWNVSMRIHNASSRIEPSLKFDVQLLAMPSTILTQIEPWGDLEIMEE